MLRALFTIIQRDLLVAFRRRSELVNPILFYVIVITLFPLGVTPDQEFLSQLAPGVVWVAALLAALISMDSIFRQDFDDGSVEQLFLKSASAYLINLWQSGCTLVNDRSSHVSCGSSDGFTLIYTY